MAEKPKIKKFVDLIAWQEGHKFAIMIYKEIKKFPEDEKFGMISQMKRAAVSITSNIAEGFSRRGIADKARFYYISQGSLTEIQNQLILCRDLKYLKLENFEKLIKQSVIVNKLIYGLIKGCLTNLK